MKYNKFGYLGAALLIALSVYFVSLAATPAPGVKVTKYDAGLSYSTSWTSLDSTVSSYVTDYFDVSNIDQKVQTAGLVYVSYSMTSTGGANDTLTLTLEGKDDNDVVQTLGNGIIYGSTTGGATFTQIDTLTKMLPNVRFKVSPYVTSANYTNRNAIALKIDMYCPDLDVIPSSGQVRW